MSFESHLILINEPADINAKLSDQALLFFKVSQKLAEVANLQGVMKLRLRRRKDDLYLKLRSKKQERKLSERDIDAFIELDAGVQKLQQELHRLEVERLRLELALEALKQRYGMLKALAENLREESRDPLVRR